MKNLHVRMNDALFLETEHFLQKLGWSRDRYISEAVAFYNSLQKRKLLAAQLKKESKLVSRESMKILREFESV